jgi:hypothetical protein
MSYFNNGKKDGLGVEYFENGDEYIGEYRLGLKHGYGSYKSMIPADVSHPDIGARSAANAFTELIYTGEFKNDMRHGKGRLEQKGIFTYDGNWAQNKRDGFGY